MRINTAKIATNENARNATIKSYENIVAALKTATEVPITDIDDTITYDIVEPITTVPTMKIGTYEIKAAIFGQGLAGKVAWDGTITMFEEFKRVKLDECVVRSFSDNISVKLVEDNVNNINEVFSKINVDEVSLPLLGFDDVLGVNEIVINYIFETDKNKLYEYNTTYVSSEEKFVLNTSYTFTSEEQTIDSGKMCAVTIDTSKFVSVQSIEVGVV